MSQNLSELSGAAARARWTLFAGLAFLIVAMVVGGLLTGGPAAAPAGATVGPVVGGPVAAVMAMVMLLSVLLSLFLILTVERVFRAFRAGAVFTVANARRIQIIGGIMFLATCLHVADSLLEQMAARAHMPAELAAQATIQLWPLPVDLPLFAGALAIFVIGRAMHHAAAMAGELARTV